MPAHARTVAAHAARAHTASARARHPAIRSWVNTARAARWCADGQVAHHRRCNCGLLGSRGHCSDSGCCGSCSLLCKRGSGAVLHRYGRQYIKVGTQRQVSRLTRGLFGKIALRERWEQMKTPENDARNTSRPGESDTGRLPA